MLAVLRRRNFALLWLASLVNQAGDVVLFVGLPFYVYELTGSVLASGAMFIAGILPRLLLGSVAGVFVDRWDRRRVAVAADLTRVVVLLPLLAVRSAETVWIVYAVGLVEAAIGQFAMPAKGALLPRLVDDEQLTTANALASLVQEINRLLGPPLGAALLTLAGLRGIILFDSASFLVSGLLITLIAMPPAPVATDPANQPGSPWATVWREWLAGLRLVPANRAVTAVFIAFGLAMIAEGFFNILFIPFVKDVLGGGPPELAMVMTAQAIGGLSGGLLLGRWGQRLPPVWLVPLSGATLGLVILSLALAPPLSLVLLLAALAGLAVMGFFVTLVTLLQRAVADAYRGRLLGAFNTTNALLTLVGMVIAGALATPLGTGLTFALAGLLDLAAALAAFLLLRRTRGEQAAGSRPVVAPDEQAAASG